MRNREIKIFILGCIGLCLPFFLIAAAASREMLIVCVSLAAVLISAFCLFTAWRYRRLRQLNDQMRRVREGLYQMNPQDYEEGELSILHSEIYKVTVQLRESAEQLQAQQQFLSDSLSDISHQLKTPLTSMMMMVAAQLTRMRWLIQSLLKMAKLQAGAVQFLPNSITIRALINKALSQAEAEMLRNNVEWVLECPESFVLTVDENWTAEALGNILRNCAEHAPNGQIRILCTRTALVDQIVDLPHLFERFSRGKNAKPDSVGIGLAMSQQILAAQAGTLSVESTPGRGSRFLIRFVRQVI